MNQQGKPRKRNQIKNKPNQTLKKQLVPGRVLPLWTGLPPKEPKKEHLREYSPLKGELHDRDHLSEVSRPEAPTRNFPS